MSTSEIDSILTKIEKLSTNEKKLLIKRVVDLLGKPRQRSKSLRPLRASQQQRTDVRRSQRTSALDESIAAYATQHGGSPENVDLDPELEAASVEYLLDANVGNGR